jgi:hypothetical protein
MGVGTNGKIEVYEHFLGFCNDSYLDTVQPIGTRGVMGIGIGAVTFDGVVDEPGGIQSAVTDTTDDDNQVFYIGPFKPADGGCWMEARFKAAAITGAMYAGFTETLDGTTPVMPAEFATESFVCNGTGGMVGIQFDADGTTDDWRAVVGDGGAALVDCDSLATAANNPPVADKFDTVRVEIDPAGYGSVYLADDTGGLRLIKKFSKALTATDLEYAVVMIENRANSVAQTIEVDYFNAGSCIDWTQ